MTEYGILYQRGENNQQENIQELSQTTNESTRNQTIHKTQNVKARAKTTPTFAKKRWTYLS